MFPHQALRRCACLQAGASPSSFEQKRSAEVVLQGQLSEGAQKDGRMSPSVAVQYGYGKAAGGFLVSCSSRTAPLQNIADSARRSKLPAQKSLASSGANIRCNLLARMHAGALLRLPKQLHNFLCQLGALGALSPKQHSGLISCGILSSICDHSSLDVRAIILQVLELGCAAICWKVTGCNLVGVLASITASDSGACFCLHAGSISVRRHAQEVFCRPRPSSKGLVIA